MTNTSSQVDPQPSRQSLERGSARTSAPKVLSWRQRGTATARPRDRRPGSRPAGGTQPWLFRVTTTAIDVFVDAERHIGSVDPCRREQHVGLGCALENLALACRARGLQPDVVLLPDGPDATRVAQVDLTPRPVEADARYAAIGSRHTNRGPYERRGVTAATPAALVDSTGLPGVEVRWITAPAPMATLSQLMVDAARAVVADEDQSRDGVGWFRSNDDAVQSHRDGLTLDAQGLSPLILSVAKLLPASTHGAGDTFWADQTRTVHTATAAEYGVLTAASADDRATQLRAGRLLQRIGLTATADGVALQHMNQITERIDAHHAAATRATFGPRCAELLPPAAKPLVAFRVGYPVRDARPSATAGSRAVCTATLLVPGLLGFSTVGWLWYLPGSLLVTAGFLSIDSLRHTAAVVSSNWLRCLLALLGAAELLMVAGAAPVLMAVGAVGGVALVAAATVSRSAASRVALVVLGTVPFAALASTAVFPVLLLLAAAAFVVPLTRHPSSPPGLRP